MNTQATMSLEENGISFDISMLNGLPDPFFFVDLNHVIVDCNRAAKQLLGSDVLVQNWMKYSRTLPLLM